MSHRDEAGASEQRILLITRNLPPLVGGMERLNWHMADELAQNASVYVIGPAGSAALGPASTIHSEAPLKPLPLFLLMAFIKGLWQALRWKPNIILAGSGLTAPLAWILSKICRARSAAYLHGLDITVEHPVYRMLWRPTFKRLDRVIVNSSPTQALAIEAGVEPDAISIVYPGVSLPLAAQPGENIAAFRAQHELNDRKILLSVGRLTTRKGLREFVEHALPQVVQATPDAMLVVIGEAPRNSLGANIQSTESIQQQATRSGVGEHVRFLGVITDPTQLATAYEAADVHVFPVRHIPNDPEGFGMVAIEAAAHGLPTVAFSTGGVVDAVSDQSGVLVKPEEYRAMADQILKLLSAKPLSASSCKEFAEQFTWRHFGANISNALCEPRNPDRG